MCLGYVMACSYACFVFEVGIPLTVRTKRVRRTVGRCIFGVVLFDDICCGTYVKFELTVLGVCVREV